jgi:ubiquinone/menaquinone biosynthesis C-methylase UbiE
MEADQQALSLVVQPSGGAVLDAGCGSGRLAVEIARPRPDLRVRGFDLERGMVEVATRRAARENVGDRVEFTPNSPTCRCPTNPST